MWGTFKKRFFSLGEFPSLPNLSINVIQLHFGSVVLWAQHSAGMTIGFIDLPKGFLCWDRSSIRSRPLFLGIFARLAQLFIFMWCMVIYFYTQCHRSWPNQYSSHHSELASKSVGALCLKHSTSSYLSTPQTLFAKSFPSPHKTLLLHISTYCLALRP